MLNRKFLEQFLDNASFGMVENFSNPNLQFVYEQICELFATEDVDNILIIVLPLAKGIMSKKALKKHICLNIGFIHMIEEENEKMLLDGEPEGDSLYW